MQKDSKIICQNVYLNCTDHLEELKKLQMFNNFLVIWEAVDGLFTIYSWQ